MAIPQFRPAIVTAALLVVLRSAAPVIAMQVDPDSGADAPALTQPEAVPLDRDVVVKKVTVGPGGVIVARDGRTAGGSASRLIYSNTLGISLVHFPTNRLVADDIATTAPDGCNLRSFQFKVLGKVLSTGSGGPFTVKYALYSNCPGALGSTTALQDLAKIPGTTGEIAFPDDAPRTIEHVIDAGTTVAIPSNLYLGLQFNRGNCGPVLGSPATVGFSADQWDFPGFPCNGHLGGFPTLPHASFWAEVYGDEGCAETFPGYKVARPSGGVAAIGANVQGVDDVHLQVRDCRMVGYEVVVKGAGLYTFDLRQQCDGQIIPGTEKTFIVPIGATPLLQVARFAFDPPIPLPDDDLFLGFRCSSSIGGVVIAGIQPSIGDGSSEWFTIGPEGCSPVVPTQGTHGAVNLAITCAGQPPTGACCDMALTECQGGPDDGKRCPCNALCVGGSENGHCCTSDAYCAGTTQPPGVCVPSCAAPGSCEALCRELPHMNCQSEPLMFTWLEGKSCESPPFIHACGLAACCKPDDTCENLTKNQCDAVEPLDRPRVWQGKEFCFEGPQACPFNACLSREGDCLRVRTETGCNDPFCCADVCDFDPWCCQVAWDEICLRWADSFCPRAPSNDQCAPDFPVRGFSGAFEVPVPGVLFGTNSKATESEFEPGFCCHKGTGTCAEGPRIGEPCIADDDCDVPGWSGQCSDFEPMPGAQAFGMVWHKFVATHSTAKISTCGSKRVDPRFTDSFIQVFAAQDRSTPLNACNSLHSFACSDDAGSACPGEPGNTQLCVGGLTAGRTYYVMLGSKLPKYQGLYRLEITTPCDPKPPVPEDPCFDPVAEDCQPNGTPDDEEIANCAPQELPCRDCNGNGVPDECDTRNVPQADLNHNGKLDVCENCPEGLVALISPPSRVIDAGRPYPPGQPENLEGILALQLIMSVEGAKPQCWGLCETLLHSDLHPSYPVDLEINEIQSVVEDPPGTYLVTLKRPITPGETTTITYTDDEGVESFFSLVSHPGNVDADFVAQPADLLALVDIINGISGGQWGLYSTDCDHSGQTTPADILCVIDLLNSGWNGTSRPPTAVFCP